MIEVIGEQQNIVRQCETCGCTVQYLYSDLNIRKTKIRKGCGKFAYGAYKYVECPKCEHDIKH